MTAECCSKCAKWSLIVFNLIFCLLGIGAIAVGTYTYIQLRDYLDFFGDVNINAPAIVLIFFGCVTFIIAAIGCIGAWKENPCLLFTFAGIIVVLLLAELIAGIVAFLMRDTLQAFVEENAKKLMKTYNESVDNGVKESWDLLHDTLECCGVSNSDDWTNTTIASGQNGTVPASCKSYTRGCIDQFLNFAFENIYVIGGAGVAFGCVELTGIVLACVLGCAARKADYS